MVLSEGIPFSSFRNFYRKSSFEQAKSAICFQVSAPQITDIIAITRI
ncbi:MAG: hypothetical protein H7098_00095 [Oligoflexus sp.]|nr:hypothetical protein [Pseudopedobacter sp.]